MGDLRDNAKPLHYEARCKVCNSSFRPLVDRLWVNSYRATSIARLVQDVDPELTRKSIERHCKRHITLHEQALREILERRAEEAEILSDEHRAKIATRGAVLDAMIDKGWEQVTDPNAKVYYKDVLTAIELQARLEHEQIEAVADTAKRQLAAIAQAIREVAAPEVWNAIALRAQEIYESPLLELEVATSNGNF